MKQLYFLLIAITVSIFCFAQTEGACKVYGYKQKVMPGMVRVDVSGREIPRKPQYNYFIYLASNSKVTLVEIWLDGEAYTVTVNPVSTPVEYSNPTSGDNKTKTLVPKTTGKVMQLSPSLNKIKNPAQKGKTLSVKNELVIFYKVSGKLYYKTLSKLKSLDAVAMQ